MADFFWFSDEQWARIEPLLPQDTRGMPRVDDRRVLSGIVHALKSGGRWGDCPEHVYGPKKTLYNRFRRWAERGVWERIFADLAGLEGARQHLFQPRSFGCAAPAGLEHDRAAADDQQPSQCAFAHLRDRAQLLFAAG